MTDKKSIESRRKLLKSIAAGSGAIVAGKSLPENWTKPVVDSVMLPAHALTSACTTINISFDITTTNFANGSAGYSIYPVGSVTQIDGDGGDINDGIDETFSFTYGPGQYLISASFAGIFADGSITGIITVSCCNGDTLTIVDETITATGFANGCALVTLGEDGTCRVEISSDCPT